MSLSFIRDKSGVLINTDESYYKGILTQRQYKKKAKDLELQLDAVKEEILQIRELITQMKATDN